MLNFFEINKLYLLYPIFFGMGIVAYFVFPFEPLLLYSCVFALFSLFFFLIYKNIYVLLLLFLSSGFFYADIRTVLNSHYALDAPISFAHIEGVVKEVSEKGKQTVVIIENPEFVNKSIEIKLPNRIKLSIRDSIKIKYGDVIRGHFKLYPKSLPASFLDSSNLVSLWYDKIGASGFSMSKVEILKYETLHDFENIRYKATEFVADIVKKHLKHNERAIALALTIGDRGEIDKKITNNYQASGISHILSVSGMHMSLVSLLVFYFIRSFLALFPFIALRYDIKKVSAVFAMVTATLYLNISGLETPAIRSYIMVMVVLFAVLINRKAISLRNIAVSAFIIMFYRPDTILTPSFQMSFMAITAIVAVYEMNAIKIIRKFNEGNFLFKIFMFILGIIITDFAATLATFPIVMFHFNKTSVYSLLGNIVAGPLISFIVMPFLFIGIIFDSSSFFYISGKGIHLINVWADIVAKMDGVLYNKSMPLFAFGFCIISFMGFVVFSKTKAKILCLSLYFTAMLSVFFVKIPDFIINSQGNLFAVKGKDGKLWFNSYNKDKRLRNRIAIKSGENPDKVKERASMSKLYFKNICDKDACIYKDFVMMKGINGCIKGKVIIDLNWLGCDYENAIKINRKDLALNGTYMFWYEDDGNITYKTAKDRVGNRLWSNF